MIAVTTLVWFFATILMMGFFAGIEMAFYSANRLNIELKKKQGGTTRTLNPFYFCTQSFEPSIDILVSPVYLFNILNHAFSFST